MGQGKEGCCYDSGQKGYYAKFCCKPIKCYNCGGTDQAYWGCQLNSDRVELVSRVVSEWKTVGTVV